MATVNTPYFSYKCHRIPLWCTPRDTTLHIHGMLSSPLWVDPDIAHHSKRKNNLDL